LTGYCEHKWKTAHGSHSEFYAYLRLMSMSRIRLQNGAKVLLA